MNFAQALNPWTRRLDPARLENPLQAAKPARVAALDQRSLVGPEPQRRRHEAAYSRVGVDRAERRSRATRRFRGLPGAAPGSRRARVIKLVRRSRKRSLNELSAALGVPSNALAGLLPKMIALGELVRERPASVYLYSPGPKAPLC